MPKWIIYLYRGPTERISQLTQNKFDGVYHRPGTVLVGIDTGSIDRSKRFEIEQAYSLREFEVEQKKFDYILKKLPSLGAIITSVEVFKSYLFPDLEEQLKTAVCNQDISSICSIVEEYRTLGNDIESVEFYLEGNRIRFTKLAALDISSDKYIINEVMNTLPVGVLSGVIREDGE